MSRRAPTSEHIRKDLDQLLKTFTPASDNNNTASDAFQISDVQPIASYSWINNDTIMPTIAVPGSPKIWTNLNPTRVQPDSGFSYIDQDSYYMGATKSPLLPIFAAIDDLHGCGYDYKMLDLISDRNSLRRLFRWAVGGKNKLDPFRIDVDLAGNTCLFTRREAKDSEIVYRPRGFGVNYEKAATRLAPGCKGMTGHSRIISMNFSGLKVLLRFNVNACTGVEADADDLSKAFSGLGITSTDPPTSTSGISIIRTTPRTLVPQSSLIEVATRAENRSLDWNKTYPQLYLSQTPNVYLAKHTDPDGTFVSLEKFSLTGDDVRMSLKQKTEAGMLKLKAVLGDILDAVRNNGGKKGSAFCLVYKGRELALYKRREGTGRIIGSDILSRFE